jgi:hypothetical protein
LRERWIGCCVCTRACWSSDPRFSATLGAGAMQNGVW